MTSNQIAYWALQENKRANAEIARSNRAREEETSRHNLETERKARDDVANTLFANQTSARAVDETVRHNKAQERISNLDRTQRIYTSDRDRASREAIAAADRKSREYQAEQDRNASMWSTRYSSDSHLKGTKYNSDRSYAAKMAEISALAPLRAAQATKAMGDYYAQYPDVLVGQTLNTGVEFVKDSFFNTPVRSNEEIMSNMNKPGAFK